LLYRKRGKFEQKERIHYCHRFVVRLAELLHKFTQIVCSDNFEILMVLIITNISDTIILPINYDKEPKV